MESNFSSKLFEKQLNLKEANMTFGAETGGCVVTEMTGTNNCDSTSTAYDDNGKLKRITSCNQCEEGQ